GARPGRGRPPRLPRRDRPGPLVSRAGRRHPRRRHREADQGRDRRPDRGAPKGPGRIWERKQGTMSTAARLMTADEFLVLPDDGLWHELVRGEVTTMPLPGGQHGRIAM